MLSLLYLSLGLYIESSVLKESYNISTGLIHRWTQFKVPVIIYKAMRPSYLKKCLLPEELRHALHASSEALLHVPPLSEVCLVRMCCLGSEMEPMGQGRFAVAAPRRAPSVQMGPHEG